MTAPTSRTVLLAPACIGVRAPSGAEFMSWARAQSARYALLLRFDRFVCFPAAFPKRSAEIDHCRAPMASSIASRVAGGGLAIFLVPSWKPDKKGVDEAWSKSAWVVEAVTGVRVRPLIGRGGLRIVASPDCPPAIAGLLERVHASYEFRLPVDVFGSPMSHQVLGAIESPTGTASAIAGFPGDGAWLIVPSDVSARVTAECGVATGLLDVLDSIRPRPRGIVKSEGRVPQSRPRAGTKLLKALVALESASPCTFVGVGDRKAIQELKSKYGVRIESVADARGRGAVVPESAKGYRLVPIAGR